MNIFITVPDIIIPSPQILTCPRESLCIMHQLNSSDLFSNIHVLHMFIRAKYYLRLK